MSNISNYFRPDLIGPSTQSMRRDKKIKRKGRNNRS